MRNRYELRVGTALHNEALLCTSPKNRIDDFRYSRHRALVPNNTTVYRYSLTRDQLGIPVARQGERLQAPSASRTDELEAVEADHIGLGKGNRRETSANSSQIGRAATGITSDRTAPSQRGGCCHYRPAQQSTSARRRPARLDPPADPPSDPGRGGATKVWESCYVLALYMWMMVRACRIAYAFTLGTGELPAHGCLHWPCWAVMCRSPRIDLIVSALRSAMGSMFVSTSECLYSRCGG